MKKARLERRVDHTSDAIVVTDPLILYSIQVSSPSVTPSKAGGSVGESSQ